MMWNSQRGRGSAGPRASTRVLDETEVLGRRDHILRDPPSPERTAALRKIRNQLASINRRVTHG